MSGIITSLPMGSQGNFSFSSLPMISVPPVVAPWENTNPSPTPIPAPPYRVARIGSIGGKVCIHAITSMAKELTAMAYRLLTSRRPPRSRQPARNSGTLTRMDSTPTGRTGTRAFTIWARPVTPPMAIWLGATNQSNARA